MECNPSKPAPPISNQANLKDPYDSNLDRQVANTPLRTVTVAGKTNWFPCNSPSNQASEKGYGRTPRMSAEPKAPCGPRCRGSSCSPRGRTQKCSRWRKPPRRSPQCRWESWSSGPRDRLFLNGHGSKARLAPSEHPNPHKNRRKLVVHLPQIGIPLVLTHSHMVVVASSDPPLEKSGPP